MGKTSSAHFWWMQSPLGFTLWLQSKLKTLIPWREVAYSRLGKGSCKAFNKVWKKTRMKLKRQREEPPRTSRVFFSDPHSPETSNSVKYLSLSDEAAHSYWWLGGRLPSRGQDLEDGDSHSAQWAAQAVENLMGQNTVSFSETKPS